MWNEERRTVTEKISSNAIGRNHEIQFYTLGVDWEAILYFSMSTCLSMVSFLVPACVNGEPEHRPEACMTYDRTEGVVGTLDTWCDKNQS